MSSGTGKVLNMFKVLIEENVSTFQFFTWKSSKMSMLFMLRETDKWRGQGPRELGWKAKSRGFLFVLIDDEGI